MNTQYNLSVLFVEDDVEVSQQYVRMLKKIVKTVHVAYDGLEGLTAYNDYKPDIIISDISMPYLSGLDLVQKIRETDNKTKIILLSAYSEKEKLLSAIKLRLESYLIKPVGKEDLKNAIHTISMDLDVENKIKLTKGYFWNNLTTSLYDKDNIQIKLTKKETLLFSLLGAKSDQFFSSEEILEHVYKDSNDLQKDTGRLRTMLSRLKSKLTAELIESIYGFGYRLKLDK